MDAKELTDIFAENIATLPIGPITIATKDGPREVDALLLRDWALNENSQGWTVTHRKSGYAGKNYPTPIEALVSLGVFLGAGFLSVPDEVTPDAFGSIPDIRSISRRVKAGLSVLDGWDLDLDYNESDHASDFFRLLIACLFGG